MGEAERYFALPGPPGGASPGAGRYVELGVVPPVEFLSGLEFRPVTGERSLVSFVRYEPGTVVPRHAHAEEQITFVLEGEFEFDLDGDVRLLRPGTVAVIPPFVPHAARTLGSPCVQVDVFCPPRQVLLEAMRAAGG